MTKTIAAVLSGGKGSRMQSSLPKVLHLLNGKPLLQWSMESFSNSICDELLIVVSPVQPEVIQKIETIKNKIDKPINICFQNQPLGTGDAVKCAVSSLQSYDEGIQICVGFGDTPAASAKLITSFLEFHKNGEYDLSIITFEPADSKGYGRVFLEQNGCFKKIVEDKDCSHEEKRNNLCNSGFLVGNLRVLRQGLEELRTNNEQGEYYLTDLPYILKNMNFKIGVFFVSDPFELLGVNTPEQLKLLESLISLKIKSN